MVDAVQTARQAQRMLQSPQHERSKMTGTRVLSEMLPMYLVHLR